MSNIVFKPLEQAESIVQSKGDSGNGTYLARMHLDDFAEATLNEQINVEYNISYVYESMYAYFSRDNVGLHGFAKYFKEQAEEERTHAKMFTDFLNTRGGRVKLMPIANPEDDYSHDEKGSGLYAMELALSLERLNYEKLLDVWKVMEDHADAQAAHFLEYMLEEQAEDIKKAADYVSQLRTIGKGHGMWHFNSQLHGGNIQHMAFGGPD